MNPFTNARGRRVVAGCLGAAALLLTAAPAATAAPPIVSSRSAVGDLVVCGDLVLTTVSGEIVTRTVVVSAGGVDREVQAEVLRDVVLVDDDGGSYVATGASSHRGVLRGDAETGHFFLTVTVRGPDGPVGTVKWRLRIGPDGVASFVDSGSCALLEA